MPTVANGIDYDFDLAHARGEQLEIEVRDCIARPARHRARCSATGTTRTWATTPRRSPRCARASSTTPDITLTRVQGRIKYGFGAQRRAGVRRRLRVFGAARLERRRERVVRVHRGRQHRRCSAPTSRVLAPPATSSASPSSRNGISGDHRDYLAARRPGLLARRRHAALRARGPSSRRYYTLGARYRGVFPAVDIQSDRAPGLQHRTAARSPSARFACTSRSRWDTERRAVRRSGRQGRRSADRAARRRARPARRRARPHPRRRHRRRARAPDLRQLRDGRLRGALRRAARRRCRSSGWSPPAR